MTNEKTGVMEVSIFDFGLRNSKGVKKIEVLEPSHFGIWNADLGLKDF